MLAAGAAGAALAGCQPQSSEPTDTSGNETAGAFDEHIAPGIRATATLENAEPILPEEPPAEWTSEADIVVVGTGGGGLTAALLGRDGGASVIVVEKNGTPGGATQHANAFANRAGNGREQIEKGYAWPEFPYERDKFIRAIEPHYQFSIDDDLIGNLADAAGECLDWMQDHGADMICIGPAYLTKDSAAGKVHNVMAVKEITNKFHKFGEEAGAVYYFNTPCSALITDGNRVVGIKATGSDGDMYFKANKGVILCSGGFGMNPDMLKKYIPTAYKTSVNGGPMPYHTGECTRMAIGAGADMSGIDSWCSWESEMDNGTGEWRYFWGARQITQLPWLNIDIHGKRCNYYEWNKFGSKDTEFYAQAVTLPFFQAGEDRARAQVQASRINHRAYAIFDGKFEEYIEQIQNSDLSERRPTLATDPIPEQDLFDPDWHVEFDKALADGRMKQANTLDELAEQLGLDPEVVAKSVNKWNENCANGIDAGTVYPLGKRFLNPIVEPPFYGAIIGPNLGKTLCGVRVDENLRVLTSEGKTIPGLYANMTTAGGIVGESTYGTSLLNSSFLGGNTMTWASGYLAAKTALAD
jgi:succinate dehydrogenase/fumarate reductase flavoprotein subunit